jgi:hypothetical protein
MKQYSYVVINNAGHSWLALSMADGESSREQGAPVLPQLLHDGWAPVRETPMGGGTSHLAHALILLERDARTQKNSRPKAKAK